MEDTKTYSSSTERVAIPTLRPRHVPDVPEDVDFLLEHLNDPNYDIKKHPLPSPTSEHSPDSFEMNRKHLRMSYDHSEMDTDSRFGSDRWTPSRAESRNSAVDFDDESPYPEVRAAVSSIDDPLMPVNTFRMWILGIFFSIFVPGINQMLSLRYPSVFITGIVVQLISLPMGKGLERILPTTRFRTFGYVWSLNPGPFSIKEHVCITVMANVVVAGAYATDALMTQRIFYKQELTFGYQILIVLSTQIFGFSLGGVLRQFIVWPSSMIWPGALVNSALFNTLHKNFGKSDRGHMSRERFFVIAMACSFVWYWLPGYLFTALSVFNWVCWIAPNNVAVNALFGTNTGLGMGILTFDWSMIAFIGSPLVTPWWSEMNTAASFVLCFWIIAPILYFTNTFFSAHFPMSAYTSWDNTASPYSPTAIITNGVFDVEKYKAYSPLYMSVTLILAYGISFASFAAVFVHTFLWFRRDIIRRFRNTLKDERDVHSRLMLAYPEVPHWWYAIIGIVTVVALCVAVEIYPTQLPIWAALLGVFLASILSIPLGMLQAMTNQQVPLQVMHELIAGYILPGRPTANVLFKTIAYIGTSQAITFSGDLKLGHYMKIPPRTMFMVQLVAATISCFVVTLVQDWMFSNVVDICTPKQAQGFVCPSSNILIPTLVLPIGALAPIPFYFLARRFPLSFWRYINMPVFFAGVGAIPPGTGINYASWAIVGFIFNYFIRRFHFRWWMRYNYILSAALDAGVAISIVVIFFCVMLPKGGIEVNWWGNTVWQNTADAMGTPLYILRPDETIGPSTWS
ncbi:OPT oligopeptide transporter [Infundibulicybe gibba]|nr:OPT oligopeptide transporter [Infundibulicybe gibba]